MKKIKSKGMRNLIIIIALVHVLCSCSSFKSKNTTNTDIEVVYAKEFPMIWKSAMESASINFQDGGNPIQYPNGTIWTFGDTFLKDGFRTNTLLNIGKKGSIKYLTDSTGVAKIMIPLQAPENLDEHRIWPASGIYVNEHLYVFYELVFLDDKKLDRDSVKNIGLVRSTNSWQEWDRVEIENKFPFSSPPHSIIHDEKNGSLYLYFVDRGIGLDSNVNIFRVNAEDIEDPTKYVMVGESIIKDVYGQVSVVWNEYLQKYLMCHIGNLFSDARSVYVRTSDSPLGPFSEPVLIYNKPGEIGEGFKGMFYCPYLHPELFRSNGQIIYFTYCVHEGETFSNPHLIEVQISTNN